MKSLDKDLEKLRDNVTKNIDIKNVQLYSKPLLVKIVEMFFFLKERSEKKNIKKDDFLRAFYKKNKFHVNLSKGEKHCTLIFSFSAYGYDPYYIVNLSTLDSCKYTRENVDGDDIKHPDECVSLKMLEILNEKLTLICYDEIFKQIIEDKFNLTFGKTNFDDLINVMMTTGKQDE